MACFEVEGSDLRDEVRGLRFRITLSEETFSLIEIPKYDKMPVSHRNFYKINYKKCVKLQLDFK